MSELEISLKEELWGCFKYIKIPMETVMKMPVSDRKFFIRKHNSEVEISEAKKKDTSGSATYSSPEALNEFAKTQTEYERNTGGKY